MVYCFHIQCMLLFSSCFLQLNMDTDNSAPVITYRNGPDMITLSLPVDMEFPLEKQQIMYVSL